MERNRRKFSRIAFQSDASLFLPDGEYGVEVLDLSLQGALIHPNANMFVNVGTHGTLKIRLDTAGTTIRMEVTVVHHMANYYGLVCREIDLDSVTHLRRLVELNLGNELLAEREFSQLTDY
ncbi:MAG TPA: PilZ domain-containing protein [Azonexus sp.]|nr:PilZ domain-containing protein [Azonexus sp.]